MSWLMSFYLITLCLLPSIKPHVHVLLKLYYTLSFSLLLPFVPINWVVNLRYPLILILSSIKKYTTHCQITIIIVHCWAKWTPYRIKTSTFFPSPSWHFKCDCLAGCDYLTYGKISIGFIFRCKLDLEVKLISYKVKNKLLHFIISRKPPFHELK